MSLLIESAPPPLTAGADGIVRVRGRRVTLDTLDTVVSAFAEGATAEAIVHQYPTLALADVYAVIAYYLQQRAAVDAYLAERQRQAAAIRAHNEARADSTGIRERLLARRADGASLPAPRSHPCIDAEGRA